MSRGSIQRRGRHSWRIKVDLPSTNSGRQTRHLTVRGTRRDAERELARLVNAAHDGSLVAPSKLTIGAYLQAWLANPHGLANKTVTRYRQLANYQIIPHLGMVPLQQLRPAHIVDWHAKLLAGGGVGGQALSARSVFHAHCLLHHALERALRSEIITRMPSDRRESKRGRSRFSRLTRSRLCSRRSSTIRSIRWWWWR